MHFGLFSPHKTTANATRKMVPKQAPAHDFTGHHPPTQSPVCLGGALFKTMKFDATPTPEPKWGKLSFFDRLKKALSEGVQTDPGDEQEEDLDDGLDPMTAE